MDPFYSNNSGSNASHHPPTSNNQRLNPNLPSNQNVNNASLSVPPSMQSAQAVAGGATRGVGGSSYSTSYAPQGNANTAQYQMAAAGAAAGRPMQQPQQRAYAGQPSTVQQRGQLQQQPPPQQHSAQYASPQRQTMYNGGRQPVTSPPGAVVPNPLGGGVGGGAPASSTQPTGATKQALLRSMYQSRQRQTAPAPSQQAGQQAQQLQGSNYRPSAGATTAGTVQAQPSAYGGVQQNLQQSVSRSYVQPGTAAPQRPQQVQNYQQQQIQQRSASQLQHQQHQVQRQQVSQQVSQQARMNNVQQQVQPQQSSTTTIPAAQLQQAKPSSSSSHLQQSQQQPGQKKFHLSHEAKQALREAVLSAIRHPNGDIDPTCLQRAMAQGLPQMAIVNAALVARERDRRNREQRILQQQQRQAQSGGVQPMSSAPQQQQVVQSRQTNTAATYPQTNVNPANAQMQPNQVQTQYRQTVPTQYGQAQQTQYNQQNQQSRMYQQQQQQQQQEAQRQQQLQYQRQLQAQQASIAQQRKLQEDARKKQLELQYQQEAQRRAQEQSRRLMEEEKRRREMEAARAAAAAQEKRTAELVGRMKPWGRTGYALVVKGGAKGLPPQQGTSAQNAAHMSRRVLRQSTWGGAQLCSDAEPALLGALKRSSKPEMEGGKAEESKQDPLGSNKYPPEKLKAAANFLRNKLLQQPQTLLKGTAEAAPTREEQRQKRVMAISSKLMSQQNVDMLKRHKLQPKRESKFLDRHIQRARKITADNHTRRHKELLKAIVAHQSEFYKFHRQKKNEAAKLARTIRDMHKKAEVAKEKEADQAERARLAALRANDMAAYTSLLEDTKNERLKYLLDKTDECMNQISTLLASRVAEEEEDIKVTGGEATFSENVTGHSYYETAHVKSEQVCQPSLLVGGDLKEYQLSGLQWLVSLYNNRLNGILADEMGLGKTIQTISLIAHLIEVKQNLGPYLVIVPLSTLSNWVNEFNKWLPAATVICYKGSPQQRKQLFRDEIADGHFNVLLTTYEFVIRDKGSLKKLAWQYAIVDEGHRMKNNQSKFTVTLGTHYNTRRRILLTGTPLQNSLPELWALLNFLLPAIFNSADTFDQWFNKPFSSFGKTGENADDSSNELLSNEERMLIIHRLHELLRPFMLRRIKKEVLDQLPEKVEKVIRCELSSWQKELYKQISHKIAGEAASSKNFNRGLNNVVMQLRKVCNHPYLFSKDGYHINEDIIRTSGKLELLDRMLPKLKAAGHRILMFTQMTKMMPILEDYFAYRGFSSLRLDGSTSADDREKRMYMFNAPDSPYFIFLLSTRAGGLGLNLATADTVIIFDSDWNPMMDLQAQDRAHRIGQRKDVRVFRIITQTPVEEKILSRATEKLQMNELVVEAGKFDKSGQDVQDNSLERLKMMELLLTDFDQNVSSQGAATSEEDFEKDTDVDDEEGDNKDLLNEMISSNDADYKLYCKMDLERTNAPVLYSDLKDCPDWIRYPNGKPEEGSELFDDDQPEILGKRRAAAGDKMYDDGLTEKQFCRMLDKQVIQEEKDKKKRKKKRNRNAVDTSLIVEDEGGGRKRHKTSHPELEAASSRSKASASSVAGGSWDGEITTAMNDRLISVTKSVIYFKEKGTKRKLSDIFLEKPCPQTYPDYYQIIDKPIGMNDILRKCRAKMYSTVSDFRDDWNTLFRNAVTYNGEGSWIVIDAETLKGELDRLMDKNSLSASAAESKKPVRIKLSLKKGKKKKEANGGHVGENGMSAHSESD